MDRSIVPAAAVAATALLVLSSAGVAGPVAEEVARVTAENYPYQEDCEDLHVPGCWVWDLQVEGQPDWGPSGHAVVDSHLMEDRDLLLLAGPDSPDYDAGPDTVLRAVDATTGELVWTWRWDGPAHRSDDVNVLRVDEDADVAYVVGEGAEAVEGGRGGGWIWESYTYRTYVHAVDLADGERLWTTSRDGRTFDAALVPDADRLVLGGYAWVETNGTWHRESRLVALGTDDGLDRWNLSIETNWTHEAITDLAVDPDDHLVVLSLPAYEEVRWDRVRPADGARLSNATLNVTTPTSYPGMSLAPDGERALVTIRQEDGWNGTLVDLDDGAAHWTRDVPSSIGSYDPEPPAVAWDADGDRVAVAGRIGSAGGLVLLDADDGAVVWNRSGEREEGFVDVAFSPDDRTVHVAGEGDYNVPPWVNAYHAASGELNWTGQGDGRYGAYNELHVREDDVLAAGWIQGHASYVDVRWIATSYSRTGEITPCWEHRDDPGSCDVVEVTTGGDARAEVVAVSAAGNATCEGPCAAASGGGDAEGGAAASGEGAARGSLLAASATGPATVCQDRALCLASASATGDATGGWLAASATGDAAACYERDGRVSIARCNAASALGDAEGDQLAVSLTGDSTSEYVGVSGTGHADGGFGVEASGCDTLAAQGVDEACWSPPGLLP